MPSSSDRRAENPKSPSSISPRVREKLKAFLRRLGENSSTEREHAGNDRNVYGPRAWWLNYCTEQALNATSLDDALKWHGRIVRELTRRIEIASGSEWPTSTKTRVMFDLMHERINHNAAILNIDRALRRKESVDWQWW